MLIVFPCHCVSIGALQAEWPRARSGWSLGCHSMDRAGHAAWMPLETLAFSSQTRCLNPGHSLHILIWCLLRASFWRKNSRPFLNPPPPLHPLGGFNPTSSGNSDLHSLQNFPVSSSSGSSSTCRTSAQWTDRMRFCLCSFPHTHLCLRDPTKATGHAPLQIVLSEFSQHSLFPELQLCLLVSHPSTQQISRKTWNFSPELCLFWGSPFWSTVS